MARYTEAEKDTYEPPPCRWCGAPSRVEWLGVRDFQDPEDMFMPDLQCSRSCWRGAA